MLQLQPVGDPFAMPRIDISCNLENLENAAHDMLHGPADLHDKVYIHRDLRWDNFIKVDDKCHKWVIIDSKAAGLDGVNGLING